MIVAAYAAFAFAYLLPDLGEESEFGNVIQWCAFMGRTFTFHVGLGLLVVLVWLVRCRLRRLALALIPVLAFALVPAAWMYRPRTAPPLGPGAITVASCNLLVGSSSAATIAARLAREQPDIILFQEYSSRAHDVIAPVLRDSYPHIITAERDDAFGQAVYSKLAPVGVPMLFPPATLNAGRRTGGVVNLSDPQIRVVVQFGGREVVVQNLHTVPPGSPSLLAEQRRMLRWLAQAVEADGRPWIVGGDFNATPESLGMLKDAGLTGTHALAGTGRGSTWIDTSFLRRLPGVRIDHVFISGGLDCDLSKVGESIGSDHRPLTARVGFR